MAINGQVARNAIPAHFRSDSGRMRQVALRLTLALTGIVAAFMHILHTQPVTVHVTLIVLCLLFAWSVPTPVAVFGTTWLGFIVLRGQADDLGLPDRGATVAAVDRWLGTGQLPTERLQQVYMNPHALGAMDIFLIAVHASFFVVPHLTALALWWHGHRAGDSSLLWRFHHLLLTIMVIGLLSFAVIPVSPPWLQATREQSGAMLVYRVVDGSWLAGSVGQSDQVYSTITDPNPVAAMPSLHLAISLATAVALWRIDRRLGLVGIGYAVTMGFSLVYLGEHYLADVLAGMFVTLVAIPLAQLMTSNVRRLAASLHAYLAGGQVRPASGRRSQSEAAD